MKNSYCKKSPPHDYGTYQNIFYNYFEKFQTQPFVFEIIADIGEITFENLLKIGARKIFTFDLEKSENGKNKINNIESCYEYEDVVIQFFRKKDLINKIEFFLEGGELDGNNSSANINKKDFKNYNCKILYQKEETLNKVKECIEFLAEDKKKKNVYLLCSLDGMLTTQKFEVRLPDKKIDLELNYGKTASEKFDKIIDYTKKNKNGLVLLSGKPGTGKSTFIKYLATKTDRKVIYLSSGSADQLTNPDFLSFIMGYRNSILLLEDAEKALRSRESQDNNAISNILNITDGVLGDCLNILIIATFNISKEKIDPALVRKGRLLIEHEFDALLPENCNKIFKSIKSKRKTETPMTLAEIYNEEENYFKKEEKSKIGF
jgi:hypothetical protein